MKGAEGECAEDIWPTVVCQHSRAELMGTRVLLVNIALAVAAIRGQVACQEPTPKPTGVTGSTVTAGHALCIVGVAAAPSVKGKWDGHARRPSPASGGWQLGDGSYDLLVHMTQHGGWGTRTPDGEPQRMRGPTVLGSAEVRHVAAYVWSISRSRVPAAASR
jgi:hypothetical protein